MEQYISKSTLVAEIERRTKEHHSGYLVCLKDILSFIDTLEVKEISDKYDGFLGKELKMVDDEIERLEKLKVKEVDLVEKATQLSQKYFPDEENIWARPNIEAERCKSACIEMVEWFKVQKGEMV